MKIIYDFFALVGLCATVMATSFYYGYAHYCPPCHGVASLFTEHCK
jgi:hypothetical protein